MERKSEDLITEPMNLIFAKIMEITTYVGMIVMVIFGAAYVFGVKPFVTPAVIVNNWHLEADKFWRLLQGHPMRGYYFFKHLGTMDCLSLIGVSILAIAPFLSLLGALFKAERLYKILFIVVMLEFVFAMLKLLLCLGLEDTKQKKYPPWLIPAKGEFR